MKVSKCLLEFGRLGAALIVFLSVVSCQTTEYGAGIEVVAEADWLTRGAQVSSASRTIIPYYGPDEPSGTWYVSILPGQAKLRVEWEHYSDIEGQWFPNDTPVVRAVKDYPSRFSPRGVMPVVGEASLIVWGFTKRGFVVIEKWTWGPLEVLDGVLIPGPLIERLDLARAGGAGVDARWLFYDLTTTDPVSGLSPARTLYFTLIGSSDIHGVDLGSGDDSYLLASSSLDGSPQFYWPELASADYRVLSTRKNAYLGQLQVFSSGTGTDPYFVVLDNDLDGVAESVFPMEQGDAASMSLVEEFDPSNPVNSEHYFWTY